MYRHIKAILAQACGLENESEIVLEKPKNKDLGHLATPLAFSLAKIKRQNPKLLAEELSVSLAPNSLFYLFHLSKEPITFIYGSLA